MDAAVEPTGMYLRRVEHAKLDHRLDFGFMSSDLRKKLINELSELSLSLSDGLERIGEFDADNASSQDKESDSGSKKSADQNEDAAAKKEN